MGTGGVFGASGSHATAGSGTAQNTAGPHNSDMMNKIDPRVDSDRDGSKTYGYEPKFRPTMQCHVGLYFLSNSFLMNAAMSLSMLYFSRAWVAQSMASCCMSSDMPM